MPDFRIKIAHQEGKSQPDLMDRAENYVFPFIPQPISDPLVRDFNTVTWVLGTHVEGVTEKLQDGPLTSSLLFLTNHQPPSLSQPYSNPWFPHHAQGTGIARQEGLMEARWKGFVENKAFNHSFEIRR